MGGGYWFVSCIMLYYVVLWYVRRYAEHKPLIPFVLCSAGVIIWYAILDKSGFEMYGGCYFKWMFFFLFMLAGAYIGNGTIQLKSKPWLDGLAFVSSMVLFYGIQYIARRFNSLYCLNLASLIPLMGIVVYGYKLCCAYGMMKMMHTKLGWCVRLVAGLCLEAYIVQVKIIPIMEEKIGDLFPASLFITFLIVIIVAYLTRCLGRVFSQIFEKEDMDWKKVFELV